MATQCRQQGRLVGAVDRQGGDRQTRGRSGGMGQRLRVLVDQGDLVVAAAGKQATTRSP
jgi:hypothetical protein